MYATPRLSSIKIEDLHPVAVAFRNLIVVDLIVVVVVVVVMCVVAVVLLSRCTVPSTIIILADAFILTSTLRYHRVSEILSTVHRHPSVAASSCANHFITY